MLGSCYTPFALSRILVVEDDPDIAELIRHYLEKAGTRSERLATGSGVMARLKANRADS